MKLCKKCLLEKNISEFSKNNRNKDGFENSCKSCISIKNKELYQINKESYLLKGKIMYRKHKGKRNSESKEYYEKNKKSILDKNKEYVSRPDISLKTKEYQKNYHKSEKYKNYKKENSDRIKLYDKSYRENPEVKNRINKQSTERNKLRKSIDPLFKLTVCIRSSISNNFRCGGFKKSKKTEEILGCSFSEFKVYLESEFEDWMNWDNKGLYNGEFNYGWDIDHIIPLNTASSEEDILKLNHFTNLQPLCSKINREIKRENYEVQL
jgi:hypothetical protein